MKAFWWFEENSIAGMARPGFNQVHWFNLPFVEALLMGWIGQYSSGTASLESFRHHLRDYAPRVFKFYNLDERSGPEAIRVLTEIPGLESVLDRLIEKTHALEHFSIADDAIHFKISTEHLQREIDALKSRSISRVVSLTEKHHNTDILKDHFSLHHLGIQDLGAPRLEQAQELAEIIKKSQTDKETLAVHCLAGIGRTSTMLIAAHLLLGESLPELEARLAKRNPNFVLTGSQGEFVRSVAASAQ